MTELKRINAVHTYTPILIKVSAFFFVRNNFIRQAKVINPSSPIDFTFHVPAYSVPDLFDLLHRGTIFIKLCVWKRGGIRAATLQQTTMSS